MNKLAEIESYFIKQREFNYNTVDYSLDYFLDKVTQEEMKQLHWNNEQQSYFIESLLIGLPVLHIIQTEHGEIIDGSQKLYSAINFINNNLRLVNLEQLSLLNDFSFSDLIPSRQQRFKRITVRVVETALEANISQWQHLIEFR